MLLSPLAVIGIFMLGASAGSLVTYAKYRGTIGEFRRALEYLVVNDPRIPEDVPVVRHAVRPEATGRVEAERGKNRKSEGRGSMWKRPDADFLLVGRKKP